VGDIAHNNLKMEDKIMREHKMFIVVLAFAILQSITLWGQQPNDEVVWVKYPDDLLPGFNYNIRNAVYSPDGQTILVSFTGEETGWHKADIKCTEVDAVTGAFIREVPIQGIIQFSADGEYVYTYDWKKVRWPSLEVVGQFPLEETPAAEAHPFAIDEVAGVMLIVGDDKVHRFDLNTFQELPSSKTIKAEGKYTWVHTGVYIAEKGKYFFTSSKYSTSSVTYYREFTWDIRIMDTTSQYPISPGIKYSPDGKWIGRVVFGQWADSVLFYDANTYIQLPYGHLQPDNGGCETPSDDWSHDSRYFITSSFNCNEPAYTCVWDVLEGKAAYKYKTEWGADVGVRVSLDDKYILLISSAGLAMLNFLKGTDVPLEPKVSNTLYPNPTDGTITIPSSNFKTGKLRIELTRLDGNQIRVLFDNIYQGNDLIFDLSGLPQGTYFIKAIQGKTITTFKVIKMR